MHSYEQKSVDKSFVIDFYRITGLLGRCFAVRQIARHPDELDYFLPSGTLILSAF